MLVQITRIFFSTGTCNDYYISDAESHLKIADFRPFIALKLFGSLFVCCANW